MERGNWPLWRERKGAMRGLCVHYTNRRRGRQTGCVSAVANGEGGIRSKKSLYTSRDWRIHNPLVGRWTLWDTRVLAARSPLETDRQTDTRVGRARQPVPWFQDGTA